VNESAFLNMLKAKQASYALEALRAPSQKNSFEYGVHAGTVKGLEMAINLLIETISEEKYGSINR